MIDPVGRGAPCAALQIRDAAATQAGSLGQLLLGQPGGETLVLEQNAKRPGGGHFPFSVVVP